MKPTKLEELWAAWLEAVLTENQAIAARDETTRTIEKAMVATNRAYDAYLKEKPNERP